LRFWDSSALVPLLVREEETARIRELYLENEDVVVWWATAVECASAVARLERDEALSPDDATRSFDRLTALASSWHTIEPTESVRDTAKRLLRVHDLRSADALQLAAAFLAAEGSPRTLPFVCLDRRLRIAAQREGFARVS
jgi:predicted nucleic acid-binding protein